MGAILVRGATEGPRIISGAQTAVLGATAALGYASSQLARNIFPGDRSHSEGLSFPSPPNLPNPEELFNGILRQMGRGVEVEGVQDSSGWPIPPNPASPVGIATRQSVNFLQRNVNEPN